jgi:RNA ligase
MKQVILLCGPMGSGKTTFAEDYCHDYYRISQDDHGKVEHIKKYDEALSRGEPFIIIDRINHLRNQRKAYLDKAKAAGYKTKIISMQQHYSVCYERVMHRKNHPTLKADSETVKKALSMYFQQYEYVLGSEADEVQRRSHYDPFMWDMTEYCKGKRIIAIGDVHGCWDQLDELLTDIEWDEDKDIIFFTGDLVDRGPQVNTVLKFIKTSQDAGINVYSVMSNHEHKFLRYLKGNKVQLSHGLSQTVGQVDPKDHDKYRVWLESLPYIIKFGTNYICHAGINPTQLMNHQRRDTLLYARTFNPDTGSYVDATAKPWYEFEPKQKDMTVYFGHTYGLPFDVAPWAKALDGGCVHGGVLRACVINTDGTTKVYEVKSDFTFAGQVDEETADIHPSLMPFETHYQNKYVTKAILGDLVSYKYTDAVTYGKVWDEFTRKARGSIYNSTTGECVALGYSKFWNYLETPESTNLPDEPYEVFDKADGSCGLLFWVDDEPRIATMGSFTSDQAIEATKMLTELYPDVKSLNRDITLIFEIIYPENKIVVDYQGKRQLLLLSAFNRKTGEELPRSEVEYISNLFLFPIVQQYRLTIAEMIELQKTLPKDREGFVVRFQSGLRVKFKGQEYLRIHRIVSGITPLNIWREMVDGQLPDEYKKLIPEELLPDVEIVEDALKLHFLKVTLDIGTEIGVNFPGISMAGDLTREDKVLIGTRVKELGNTLKHAGAVWPVFTKNDKALDKYIKGQIRPTSNRINDGL